MIIGLFLLVDVKWCSAAVFLTLHMAVALRKVKQIAALQHFILQACWQLFFSPIKHPLTPPP
jgi:hypothetical protein